MMSVGRLSLDSGSAGGADDLTAHMVELSPFIALLGGIVGLGQLRKTVSLPPFAARGFLSSALHGGAGCRDTVDCFVRRD